MTERADILGGEKLSVTSAIAAQMLGLSQRCVQLYVESGDLPASRPGKKTLIRVSDLNAFLDRHRVQPKVKNG